MGLPRYLNDKYKEFLDGTLDRHEMEDILLYRSILISSYSHKLNNSDDANLKKKYVDGIKYSDQIFYMTKKAIKFIYDGYDNEILEDVYNPNFLTEIAWLSQPGVCERYALAGERKRLEYLNSFSKVMIEWHCYYQKDINGEWIAYYTEIPVNNYFEDRALELSKQKKEKEFELIQRKEYLDNIRNIEQGRSFKGRLRQFILERDNFKCVLCGRDVSDGIKLEVDHIIPWSDGGKTTYDNGRTLCKECNIARHSTKQYNEKVKEFKKILKQA